MSSSNDDVYDDSKIAMKVAIRASLFVASAFFIMGILQFSIPRFPYDGFVEFLLKVFLVVFGIVASRGILFHAKGVSNASGIPFLSTVFFYGMMLLVMTTLQIGLIIFHIVFSDAFSLSEEMKMLFGVRDFSIHTLLLSFILGHIPYIVYFFYLRFSLHRICK